ncbi:MAG: SufB/SufD family protein, partial [Anaerolineae bacterium]
MSAETSPTDRAARRTATGSAAVAVATGGGVAGTAKRNGLAPHVGPYLADYADFARGRPGTDSESIRQLRQSAIEHFAKHGFPSVTLEEWRFTNVETLEETEFRLADGDPSGVTADDVEPYLFDGAHHLVFVDGRYAPELSRLGDVPDGLTVGSLAHALAVAPDVVDEHIGRHADFAGQPFVALNTAFIADGGYVHVGRRVETILPVHFLHVSTESEPRTASYPRNLVIAEESAAVTVVETYVGWGEYFSCAVTEVFAGPNAVVDHYKVQEESTAAYHMAMLQLDQDRDSTFASHSVSSGGRLVRYDANAYLGAEGVSSTLNGLYLARGTQHVDNHMWVEHAKPHGYSHELYKGILEGKGRAVFTG